ncbi:MULTISPECIES: hypothetical protein [unclassified Rhizobium]|uniref:hypothetical protein n=1 Tax=unclassified Rhizobium TaxID=2613769 RepID=UPI0021F731F4|nr:MULTISPECIES: hypothetical protein [unclassified Rhizobium]MCV9946103.1 hypothetical protein [Rhizobium sp. BT-175]MCW0019949.1 hypothetical protein [Rhizobium sp. BT-226]
MIRPLPPDDMIEDTGIRFEPAHDLLEWRGHRGPKASRLMTDRSVAKGGAEFLLRLLILFHLEQARRSRQNI